LGKNRKKRVDSLVDRNCRWRCVDKGYEQGRERMTIYVPSRRVFPYS
jgi:hypothetical protein